MNTPRNIEARGVWSTPIRTSALGLIVVLTCWLYFWWAGQPSGSYFSKQPSGYYGLQAKGFLLGQLNVALAPHPGLLALPDPYDPVANAPYRVHDMTLYKGKYYTYFGVVPVILLFLPCAALTGYFPTEPCAVALFCCVGFCTGLWILVQFWRRNCPNVNPGWLLPIAITWGVGNYWVALLNHATFYQVPIACASMLGMLTLMAMYHAIHAGTLSRATGFLTLASCCTGLCLGCRPNYLPVGAALLLVAIWLFWKWRESTATKAGSALRFSSAAFGPAAIIGLAILVYNFARFDSPFEFGMHYQLAGERISTTLLVSPKYIPTNAAKYLFNPGYWSPYFPFLSLRPMEPLGGLTYFPLVALGIPAFLWSLRRPSRELSVFIFATGVVGVGNLLMLSSFFGITDRYSPDFLPVLLLLGAASVMLGAEHRPLSHWRHGATAFLGLAMIATCFSGLVLMVSNSPAGAKCLSKTETAFNTLSHAFTKANGSTSGIFRLNVTFAQTTPGTREPIMESGFMSGHYDTLVVEHLDGDRVQFELIHQGLGGIKGAPVKIEYGRAYSLDALLGSTLPPPLHPYYEGWTQHEITMARKCLEVRLDGNLVLQGSLGYFASTPATTQIGGSAGFYRGVGTRFSGNITKLAVIPLARADYAVPASARTETTGATTLQVFFPMDNAGKSEPILAQGSPASGELLYVQYVAPGKLRFGIDHNRGGGTTSRVFDYDQTQLQNITVWFGTWHTQKTTMDNLGAAPSKRLFVALNDTVVLDTGHPFSPGTPADIAIGRNTVDSSLAGPFFTGRIFKTASTPYTSLPPQKFFTSYPGTLNLRAIFPQGRIGQAEPLLTTGVPGRGDFLYVIYVDEHHAVFGFDHWGGGGTTSLPAEIEYGREYTMELTTGALLAPGSLAPAANGENTAALVRVKLDGRTVFETQWASHTTELHQIQLGSNGIGGSTAGPQFTGELRRTD